MSDRSRSFNRTPTGGSSLLSAYHALPNKSTYPEQRYRLPSSSAPTLLLLKPFTLDIPAASPQSYEALDSETEPALVLFGRALQQEEGKDKDTIHRLALRVAEFVSPVSDDADGEADGDGRVVVSIKGAGGGLAWRCRLGALGDRCVRDLSLSLVMPKAILCVCVCVSAFALAVATRDRVVPTHIKTPPSTNRQTHRPLARQAPAPGLLPPPAPDAAEQPLPPPPRLSSRPTQRAGPGVHLPGLPPPRPRRGGVGGAAGPR